MGYLMKKAALSDPCPAHGNVCSESIFKVKKRICV